MVRLVVIAAVVVVVALGCSTPAGREEIVREAFHLARVPEGQRWAFRKASALVGQGEHQYKTALESRGFRRRVELLGKAAVNIRKAIGRMREILEQVERERQRDYVTHCIEYAHTLLEEVLNETPLPGE